MKNEDLDRLLARGRLPASARERILTAALARNRRQPWWRRARAAWWGPVALGAAAAVAVLVPRIGHDTGIGFRSKGLAPAAGSLSILCETGAADRCKSGQLLLFRVEGLRAPGYLTARARRIGASPGEIVLLPRADGSPVLVSPQPTPQVLGSAIRLGGDLLPGHYEVVLSLSGSANVTRLPLEVLP
jgi:hypothetical protein